MKKIALIVFAFILVLSCDNEPLDPDLTSDGEDAGTENSDLTLSSYQLDTQISLEFFGAPIETTTNSSFNITNNAINSGTNAVSINESPSETENLVITRNSSNQITSNTSVNTQGTTTNETLITYTNGIISQISYNYYGEDAENYIYNFTYNGNTITRTNGDTSISTVFTVDSSDRIVKKESFDGGFSIQTETIAYTTTGNISSSTTTGEIENNTIYQFDDNTNPLKVVFEDNYLLQFLEDDYSDEIGPQIAQFLSTNNWNGVSFNGTSFNFELDYNTSGRITSRDIAYNFGEELSFEFNERFNYVN
ncbi:hypothetical protein [Winogradskyella wichelsiae]|uniref:hypothetical protein n=1 Tax=Winogradskyella wichelsiae TaxID=2697007 RepID=UPI0015C81D6F|nr:hypothetical protein [Winogradskyella wichelsiae]